MFESLNKPLQVTLHGALIIAVFFGLSLGYQSCMKSKNADGISDKELAEQKLTEAAEQTSDDFFEDEGDEETNSLLDGESDEDQGAVDDAPAEEIEETPPPVQRAQTVASTPAAPASSSGEFLVVAGNFLIESNANGMVENLKSKGYRGAQSKVFDLSQYYTVVAGQYETRSRANTISGELKKLGIDNYVIRRKT